MKWSNLQKNTCPQCDKKFGYSSFQVPGLITCDCGFKIREKRYAEIVNSRITSLLESKWDQEMEGGEL